MTNLPPFIVHRRSPRSGITLLEVLLAAALSATLMMGLWSLFTTYSRLFETGQAKTERAQLVRSFMQRLREDLMTAGLEPSETQQTAGVAASGSTPASGPTTLTGTVVSSTTSIADFGSTADGFHDSGRIQLAEVSDVPGIGLWGTRHTLQLDVMQSVPSAVPAEPAGLSPFAGPETDHPPGGARRLPELRTIVYRFFAPGELQTGNQVAPPGLLRRELDWESALSKRTEMPMTEIATFVAGFSSSTLDDAETEATTQGFDVEPYDHSMIWVPEIVWLGFRYFDGYEWRSNWDSRRQQALPVAVEVSMVVPSHQSSQNSDSATDDGAIAESLMLTDVASELAELPPEDVYRQLIYIPAAVRPDSLSESAGGVSRQAVSIHTNSFSLRTP